MARRGLLTGAAVPVEHFVRRTHRLDCGAIGVPIEVPDDTGVASAACDAGVLPRVGLVDVNRAVHAGNRERVARGAVLKVADAESAVPRIPQWLQCAFVERYELAVGAPNAEVVAAAVEWDGRPRGRASGTRQRAGLDDFSERCVKDEDAGDFACRRKDGGADRVPCRGMQTRCVAVRQNSLQAFGLVGKRDS